MIEGERVKERVSKRERELHARASRKCGCGLRVPHSVSQSACMIIILIKQFGS